MAYNHPARKTIGRDFTVLLLGVLGLKTKTATARNNFGEWPLAIFSEVFFYFIRLHAPRSGCGQRQRYPSAGCN
jgi:hypothetical protein